MAKDKIMLALSDNALSYINTNATERKRGELVSKIIEEYSRIMAGVGELGGDDTGLLERIDNRLGRIEKQLAVLIAERG